MVLLLNNSAYCQKTQLKSFSPYTEEQGLSSYNLHKIISDPYGFVWIATQEGLNRFDGTFFKQYSKDQVDPYFRLLATDIRDLFLDSLNHLIWVLGSEGGLNAINYSTGKVVKDIIRKAKNSNDWSISFANSKNKFWIGTGAGLSVYNLDKNEFEKTPLDSYLSSAPASAAQIRLIKKDRNGNIWGCTNGLGIFILDSKTNTLLKHIPINQLNDLQKSGTIQFFSCCEINDQFLFGTSQGLRLIKFDNAYNFQINSAPCQSLKSPNTSAVNWVGIGPDRRIYIATNELISTDQSFKDPLKFYASINEFSNWYSSVSCGFFYDDKFLFLGCKSGLGLVKLGEDVFKYIRNNEAMKLQLDHVYSIWPFSEDSILAATGTGVYLINNTGILKTLKQDGFNQNLTFIEDLVITSNINGLGIVRNNTHGMIAKFFPELQKYQTWQVNSCVKLNDSIYVIGTENFNGILIWDKKNRKVVHVNENTFPLKLAADVVNTVFKDSSSNIWVLSDKAITIINKNLTSSKFLSYSDSLSLPVGIFLDICEVNNHFWLTAYGTGVIELDSLYKIKKIYSLNDNLCNTGVYKIFNYKNKKLFITSNKGLAVFNLSTKTFQNYYKEDGLHSNQFEEACGVYRNNKIYAGGVNGLTIIDPDKVHENQTPPVLYFNNIEIESPNKKIDSTNVFFNAIKVPNDYSQVKIFFSALNFSNPYRTTFQYKITELHQEWINLNTQNFISLIGLTPGIYHLEVQAFNEDGIPSEIRELTLTFLPKWYQTWWFKISAILIVAFMLYGLYRFRINNLKRAEKVRLQVASDLHDELGSTLNSIKVYSNLALMEKENALHIEKIKEASQDAISGVKDIIWILDDKKDTINHLVTRINQFTKPLCEAKNINYQCSVSDNLKEYKLGKEEKRNLYMILKEAINNSIKYSDCSIIELTIDGNPTSLKLKLSDNGIGFDEKKIVSGYGLKNIKLRSSEIGYKSTIETSLNKGTSILLEKS